MLMHNHRMSSASPVSLFTTVTGQPSSLPVSNARLNPSTGHFTNNTVYKIEEAVLPLTFSRVSFRPRVIATRTVVKILVLSFKVRAGNRSPEALTFVPVFLTKEGEVLDPGTCDIVGTYCNDDLELNATFVQKHECGKAKVRNVHVKFDLSPEDLDFQPNIFDTGTAADSGDPNATSQNLQGMSPFSQKVAAKRLPGKYNPPNGNSAPYGKVAPSQQSGAIKSYAGERGRNGGEEGCSSVDTDSDFEGLIDETLGFAVDYPESMATPPALPRSRVPSELTLI